MEKIYIIIDGIRGNALIPTSGWINGWKQKKERLENRVPTDRELLNRWWRKLTIYFIRRDIQKKGLKRNERHQWTLEDRLWYNYSHLRLDWVKHRLRLILTVPTFQDLRERWWRYRSHMYIKKQMGLESRKYEKRYFRFDTFLFRIVWCHHKQCFALRFAFLFWLILHLIVIFFAFY